MRIVFVRHGHPNYEKDCLTELGRLHAKEAAKRLQEEGIQKIYSSTCGRAYETAEYTAERLGLDIIKCDFMREISWGSVDEEPIFAQGHPWSTVDYMIEENQDILDANWVANPLFAHNRVVTEVEQMGQDVDDWMLALGYQREGRYYRVGEDTPSTIAAFGHGGAFAAILSHLFNLPFPFVCTAMGPDYTGITVVTISNEVGSLVTPKFEILNDARHIQKLLIENVYNR